MFSFRRTPVTLIVAAVAVAVELVCTVRPELRNYFYNDLRLGILSWVWSGQWWRPLTTTLLHGDLIHAAFNVYWLVMLGGWMEICWGSFRYVLITVLLGYVSTMPEFLVSNWSAPLHAQQGMVGLSGVVYGWFGVLWMGRRRRPECELACPPRTVEIFVFWFFFCWVASYMGLFHAANVAHAAGWFFGALYGAAIYAPNHRGWYRLGAVGLSALMLATLLGVPGHPLYRQHRAAEELHWQLQSVLHLETLSRASFSLHSAFCHRPTTSIQFPSCPGAGESTAEDPRNTE